MFIKAGHGTDYMDCISCNVWVPFACLQIVVFYMPNS